MLIDKPSSLLKFWKPRYWCMWVFYGWLRGSALLPLRWQAALGKRTGHLLCLLVPGKRRTVRRNLEVCFPELSPDEIGRLCKRHYESVGVSLGELAVAWFGSEEAVRKAVRIEGQEHLHEALNRGRGVLLFCGHFTAAELLHPALRPLCPKLTAMYRPMRNEMMDQIILRGRLRNLDELFPKYGVKALLQSLADNSVVYYLADQSYRGKYSAPVPFFGVPAMTKHRRQPNLENQRRRAAHLVPQAPRGRLRLCRRHRSAVDRPAQRRSGEGHGTADEEDGRPHPDLPGAVRLDAPAFQGPPRRVSGHLRLAPSRWRHADVPSRTRSPIAASWRRGSGPHGCCSGG